VGEKGDARLSAGSVAGMLHAELGGFSRFLGEGERGEQKKNWDEAFHYFWTPIGWGNTHVRKSGRGAPNVA
jgi:hypothetical protein